MKNVGSANYHQIDYEVRKAFAEKGVVVLPSSQAYKEFGWIRQHFGQKPKEGYFIWIKKSISHPLNTCITISSPKVSQNLKNLVVLEENVKAEINSVCNVLKKNLFGCHKGYSKIILKKGSELRMRHFHSWEKKDIVSSKIEFFLEKRAKLTQGYRCLSTPKKLEIKSNIFLAPDSSANSETNVLAKKSDIKIKDCTFLNGEKSRGVSRLRMIAEENCNISVHAKMVANAAGVGHLDCMGLLLDENSRISAVPELLNKSKDASLTHEASVGKISEEVLNYLRSRGLTKDGAINLIISGFLRVEEPFTYKGHALPSEIYM